ncbi:acyl-CoA dehydrogenase [Aspergillus sclerotialis]|uniref:Acyl-CoA dehydrogenase n=1 Tax=Aspergillus sclerotialis TaxID=2070753 RepID=A0A3A2ZXZ8_9EURO|nr:acyl-CoA dehydrogenase [Aspergillus sclerotialis]
MGTKELPTAELELKDMRAHMINSEGRGIATISSLLNISSSHNWTSAVACFRRALSIAKCFAKARSTLNQSLCLILMHMRLLAGLEVKHRGALHLCFFSASLLSFVDNCFPKDIPQTYAPLPRPGNEGEVIFRATTAVTKAVVYESDEPEFNILRLYRDAAVTPIWEGTTNILASDLVRHLIKGNNLDIFKTWLDRTIQIVIGSVGAAFPTTLRSAWAAIYQRLDYNRSNLAATLADGRHIIFSLAWIVAGILLIRDAERDGDEVAMEIASRWVLGGRDGVGEFALAEVVHASKHSRHQNDAERTNWDCRVVWDVDLPKDPVVTGYRTGTASKL